MKSGFRYRLTSITAVLVLVATAGGLANLASVQEAVASLSLFSRLPITTYEYGSFVPVFGTIVITVVFWSLPLFKPKPSRGVETFGMAVKRIGYALVSLAAIGYFDYTYAVPRLMLMAFGAMSIATIPLAITALRQSDTDRGQTRIIVGDDHGLIEELIEERTNEFIGYVSPVSRYSSDRSPNETDARVLADGFGGDVKHLGGLPRLDEVLVEYDVDRALLAFESPDRGDFFGALQTCYDNGVVAEVEQTYNNLVLTESRSGSFSSTDSSNAADTEFVETNLEPWDPQDRLLKRAFDVCFALIALLFTLPFTIVIAVAIKLDSPGPVFFVQDRTFRFGGTFRFYKFRSMIANAEDESGVKISEEDAGGADPRVTRVGRILRKTHLDEIPQLWSVLVGHMSVVGPRPAQAEIEHEFESGVPRWPQRWFVKPGLTGLAQIRGVTGHEPAKKLKNDLEYIHRQSFTLDVKIVARELYDVLSDAVGTLR
jgi:lipopolysaccharide/colanic/teichoic acid biosynthesis glycosyltransferase